MTTDNIVTLSPILTLVNPRSDSAFLEMGKMVMELGTFAQSRTIACNEDVVNATDDLGLIANLQKAIEEKRTGYVKPFNDHVKEVNAFCKLLTDPLEQAEKTTKTKILAYRAEQDRLRKEAEEINRLREEAARREAELTGKVLTGAGMVEPSTGQIITIVEKIDVPPAPPTRVQADTATLGTTKVRKWRVIDQKLIPEEYKILNVVLINKLVRNNIPSIPGIEMYWEPGLRVSAR